MTQDLTATDLGRLAMSLPAWSYEPARRAFHRRLKFSAFGDTLAAMVRIGLEADKVDHHPEWSNVYDTVDIWLTTHDVGGVSPRDEALAAIIDGICPPKASLPL